MAVVKAGLKKVNAVVNRRSMVAVVVGNLDLLMLMLIIALSDCVR